MSVTLTDPAPADPRPPLDVEAYALEAALRALVHLGAVTAPRGRQRRVGASQLGHRCPRRLAYAMAGTTPVNIGDPLRALIGTGVHHGLAELMGHLDGGAGRFLVETPIRYRGIGGTVDLYDRATGTVVDWKTTLRNKLARVRIDGPLVDYVVQLQTYGAGLAAAGEHPRWVALAYLAIDGTLDDLWVWRTAYDPAVAEAAVDRLNTIASAELETVAGRVDPSTVQAAPDHLCPWCPYHRADSTDLTVACPATNERK